MAHAHPPDDGARVDGDDEPVPEQDLAEDSSAASEASAADAAAGDADADAQMDASS